MLRLSHDRTNQNSDQKKSAFHFHLKYMDYILTKTYIFIDIRYLVNLPSLPIESLES